MGNCTSEGPTEADRDMRKASTKIDKMLKDHQRMLAEDTRILLLGPGESGKSTVFKQVKILQLQGGFTEAELIAYAVVVVSNILSQMRILLEQAEEAGHKLKKKNRNHAKHIMELPEGGDYLDKETGTALTALWNDDAIQATFADANKKFALNESAEYFFGRIDAVTDENYLPNQDDVLRARLRSTGIEEAAFQFEDLAFRMFDVGGQRSERRKWIHCFDCVTMILFVVSLSAYNQVLREDETQNRMKESLMLFDEIINSPFFQNTSFVLFLNKTDLFSEKIAQKISLSKYFPAYDGPLEEKPCREWIRDQFLAQKQSDQEVFIHFTCAIDTDQMKTVINAVRKILLDLILNDTGIIAH